MEIVTAAVLRLVKTDPHPYNETTLEDWIAEGDIDGMTAQQIAQEWDSLGHTEK
jgi:hypothetical protein